MRKDWQLISGVIFSCLVTVALVNLATAQERPGNPDYNWLNGKWEGPALAGGTLHMDLRVVNDNEVKGSGLVRTGPHSTGKPEITGVVKGNAVDLDVRFPRGVAERTAKYRFSYVDGKLRLKRKNDEVEYNKVE